MASTSSTPPPETPPPLAPFAALLGGALYPFRALGLLNRNRQLWVFVFVPIMVNIVVGIVLYVGLFGSIRAWLERYTSAPGNTVLEGLVSALVFLAIFLLLPVAIGWLLVRFGVVLGAPWYGQLSERLEAQLTGQLPPQTPLSVRSVLYDVGRALLFELKKLLVLLIIGLPLLLINIVPVAGAVIATVGGVLLGTLIACLDFFDSPLERRRLRFRAKLGLIRASLPASLGFGLVSFGLITIPLLNLLAIPLCVAAGTLFFSERLRQLLPVPGDQTP